jgi:hypothetical protein
MNACTSIADTNISSPSTNSILPSHSFTRGAVSAWDLCGLVGCVGDVEIHDPQRWSKPS